MTWMFKRKKQDPPKKTREQEIAENDGINIFTPGIYHGSTDPRYQLKANLVTLEEIIPLVIERATKDGQWCIDMDLVGPNEDKMRKMIAYVADPSNIKRNYEYNKDQETVDFICRDLANGSRWTS